MPTNYILKHIIEGKIEGRIEVSGRRVRRRKLLLDDLKIKRGYWQLKEAALDHTLWRKHFGRGYGPVVRQTTERLNDPCRDRSAHIRVFSTLSLFESFKPKGFTCLESIIGSMKKNHILNVLR